jgi:hypothetical protein
MFFGGDPFGGGGGGGGGGRGQPRARPDVDTDKLYETLGVRSIDLLLSYVVIFILCMAISALHCIALS